MIRAHTPDIAAAITLEQGKTLADAKGDVLRGLQVVESATAITSTLMGDKLEVSKDMDTESRRLPLGVCASISPFNFPAMCVPRDESSRWRILTSFRIPLWSAALATVTGMSAQAVLRTALISFPGNTLIIKPSERTPGASMIIAELCERAGMPPGVVNV